MSVTTLAQSRYAAACLALDGVHLYDETLADVLDAGSEQGSTTLVGSPTTVDAGLLGDVAGGGKLIRYNGTDQYGLLPATAMGDVLGSAAGWTIRFAMRGWGTMPTGWAVAIGTQDTAGNDYRDGLGVQVNSGGGFANNVNSISTSFIRHAGYSGGSGATQQLYTTGGDHRATTTRWYHFGYDPIAGKMFLSWFDPVGGTTSGRIEQTVAANMVPTSPLALAIGALMDGGVADNFAHYEIGMISLHDRALTADEFHYLNGMAAVAPVSRITQRPLHTIQMGTISPGTAIVAKVLKVFQHVNGDGVSPFDYAGTIPYMSTRSWSSADASPTVEAGLAIDTITMWRDLWNLADPMRPFRYALGWDAFGEAVGPVAAGHLFANSDDAVAGASGTPFTSHASAALSAYTTPYFAALKAGLTARGLPDPIYLDPDLEGTLGKVFVTSDETDPLADSIALFEADTGESAGA